MRSARRLPRREVARLEPHRQQRDRLAAVERLDQQRRVPLADATVGERVDAR